MNAAANLHANLHAIWLDDLAPGEGATPLFDQLFAEVDDETRALVLRACADEHTEPVAVPTLTIFPRIGGGSTEGEGNGRVHVTRSDSDRGAEDRGLGSRGEEVPRQEHGADRARTALPHRREVGNGGGVPRLVDAATTPKPRKRPAKKPAKMPAAKSPLAAQEAKLRTVRGRLADEFKTLGGNDAGEVNELGIAFACLLGLLLAPVLIAVFSR